MTPFVLKDIRVEGLQRSDAGTVFASLPFRIGDTYNDEKGAAALRALFATGLFKDVRVEVDGDVVVVKMGEKYEVLATNTLADQVFIATPAIIDGAIYLRGQNTLFCVR